MSPIRKSRPIPALFHRAFGYNLSKRQLTHLKKLAHTFSGNRALLMNNIAFVTPPSRIDEATFPDYQ